MTMLAEYGTLSLKDVLETRDASLPTDIPIESPNGKLYRKGKR